MSRWLVTGAGGMLGRDLVEAIARVGRIELTARTRAALDITDPEAVASAVAGHDLVINTAAWTKVDDAEAQEAAATAVNGTAAGLLAAACADAGVRMIQLSTDYVFAGSSTRPYGELDATGPINAYGRGKLAGEKAVLRALPETGYVVRTSWLYGAHGPNFVATMLRLAQTRDTLEVVQDQRGQPTWTASLAEQLVSLGLAAIRGEAPAGPYHGTASGQTTWFELARSAFELAGLDPQRIRPTDSSAYVRPAARPGYSVLGHDRWAAAGLAAQPDWHDQLGAAFAAGVFKEYL